MQFILIVIKKKKQFIYTFYNKSKKISFNQFSSIIYGNNSLNGSYHNAAGGEDSSLVAFDDVNEGKDEFIEFALLGFA